MASELLNWTAQIVISHASATEMTPQELLKEIKEVHGVLTSLEGKVVAQECQEPASRPKKPRAKKAVKPVKLVESAEAKAVEEEGPVFGDPDYMEFMESREG